MQHRLVLKMGKEPSHKKKRKKKENAAKGKRREVVVVTCLALYLFRCSARERHLGSWLSPSSALFLSFYFFLSGPVLAGEDVVDLIQLIY